ncbi:MAG: inositol monophosphatase family protein [Planctomycetota bacterium]|jgi:myo-inositol-1(or 4)-monophosphatase
MSDAAIMTTTQVEVARRAARAGGDVVTRYFREGVDFRQKGSWNLVSDADVESERAIVEEIKRTFPDHAILGEESHRDDVEAEHLWVVDPLDGTNNFAHQIAHFAISIAYYHRGCPECGVVYSPIRGDWFVAARGQGAFHNDEPARVASSRRLDEVLVGVGFYYDRGATMRATLAAIDDVFQHGIHGIRRFGTASLDLCMVGSGAFGAFFEYELSPWDFAAGRLFVEEAGGRVTTCRGAALPLAKTTVLASNGHLHDAMLSVVEPHVPAPAP